MQVVTKKSLETEDKNDKENQAVTDPKADLRRREGVREHLPKTVYKELKVYEADKWYKDREIADPAENLIYHIRKTSLELNKKTLSDDEVVKVAVKVIESKLPEIRV